MHVLMHIRACPALSSMLVMRLVFQHASVCCQVVESLYGQDLDSGQHGSGFPLPPYRQRLLEEHLAKVALAEAEAVGDAEALAKAAEAVKPRQYSAEEKAYSEHPWNINNLTRCKVCPHCSTCSYVTSLWTDW